jgi:hypothetical protein
MGGAMNAKHNEDVNMVRCQQSNGDTTGAVIVQ